MEDRQNNILYIDVHGTKIRYKNTLYHRVNGPCAEFKDGVKYWCFNGVFHRVDGPAIEERNDKVWYYQGKKIDCSTQEEFERLIKLRLLW